MLPKIGLPPAPGDPTCVVQDSSLQRVLEDAEKKKYTVKRAPQNVAKSKKKYYLHKGNMITGSFVNFAKAVILKKSRDLFLNSRAFFTKSRKLNNQPQVWHDHLRAIQAEWIHYIANEVPQLAQLLFSGWPENVPNCICTDMSQICTRIIHIDNQIKSGVRTG